ncbi:LOW QUALITY PROTEIN: arginine kinase-like [Temnothorax curvispinosus]|uniref:arginine kinase n=1 Tax=Temnothorax curvispinosus TaxID=300111 RepID=A0A6J1Q580_9HYME|nr:LOW QUALITY PROTEIN: arginine kinase-like [Temnothorax curvispinosus]
MERDGNLGRVYERLVKVVQEIEKKLEFLRHRRLGFLTFCPANLGTAIRASVHVRLPKLSADYQRFDEIGRARSSASECHERAATTKEERRRSGGGEEAEARDGIGRRRSDDGSQTPLLRIIKW